MGGHGRGNCGGETEVGEREKERAEGGVKRGKEGEERRGGVGKGGGFVLGMRGRKLERRRGTGYSPGRRLFHMSAPADSSGQEFRSSFCHRAYA